MTGIDQVRLLTAYNRWANERLLDIAAQLDQEQLEHKIHATLPGVSSIFTHMLGTQVFWLSRWQGREFRRPEAGDFKALRRSYGQNHDALSEFTAGLTEEALARNEKWWAAWGSDGQLEMGRTFLQVINHGTQHRSEVAVILTALGRSPGDMDLLTYLRSRDPPKSD